MNGQLNLINLTKTVNSSCFLISKRYARKRQFKSWKNNWLPFKWTRPEAEQGFFATGDVERLELFDKNLMPKSSADAIKEVGDVPPEIEKLLTYEFQRRFKNTSDFRESQVIEKAGNTLGTNSYAGRIINFTYKIRKGRKMLREKPNDAAQKIRVNIWNNKRMKFLIELSKFDKLEYNRLLKELEITPPNLVMGEMKHNRIERKRELRRLTKEYCDKIVQDRLAAYHTNLKEKQRLFEKDKAEFDEWLAKTMKELNIDESQIKI